VEQWFSSAEVAATVGVSVATVVQWARGGLIPAARVGPRGRWRFDMQAVRQTIE
jgi:excisionase family DNA binding protein